MELTATICNLIYCLFQVNIHKEIRLDFFYLTQVRSLSWLDFHSVSNSLTKPNRVEDKGEAGKSAISSLFLGEPLPLVKEGGGGGGAAPPGPNLQIGKIIET